MIPTETLLGSAPLSTTDRLLRIGTSWKASQNCPVVWEVRWSRKFWILSRHFHTQLSVFIEAYFPNKQNLWRNTSMPVSLLQEQAFRCYLELQVSLAYLSFMSIRKEILPCIRKWWTILRKTVPQMTLSHSLANISQITYRNRKIGLQHCSASCSGPKCFTLTVSTSINWMGSS